ncbi:hypothetical protein CC78DRAFT_538077 [Lojkania enalia]|uniref:Steroid 5-alpha reductase C-terminal domain-containing protein n=1 Tax=Lojkania enalia TaxID=147567 RepID=A0A9P4JWT0_9PLEO|nr:hypothetical protein CC78DRAFT_538077 [Didymosphaeria enalia]
MANVSPNDRAAQAQADDNGGPPTDKIHRGNYNRSIAGTATWIGLRAIDPLLQYYLLSKGWGSAILDKLGLSSMQIGGNALSSVLDARSILLGMSVTAAARHVYWILVLNREYFPPSFAAYVAAFNLAFDTTSSLILLSPKASTILKGPRIPIPGTDTSFPLPLLLGTAMFLVGSVTETLAEVQRKRFKERPENQGKIYTGGLWQLAQHINYAGYMLWRGGYMLAAGGIVPCVLEVLFLLRDFLGTSIKGMDEYMTRKYSGQWTRYKTDVPYKLFPGIV